MTTLSRLLLIGLSAAPMAMLLSAPAQAQQGEAERLAERLSVSGQAMPVRSVREAPMEGLFEVRLETGERFYSDAEGEHFLVGDLYRNGEQGLVNLSEESRNAERAERLSQVPESERVIFRGAQSRARVMVFTDTTCPYCQQLHEEVPRLNKLGIEVHYLAFPRSGMSGQGARTMQQVWCADNSAEAMSAAKRGDSLSTPADCDNPVESQYHLGLELGVQGTPAIVLPDGRLVPGYVPAERLAAMLGLDE
ncbi:MULTISPECIES: DsbC family protein [unclassified Halomonas]|uniref:DsbC family protein n=1 Tax=unclassified Halomonas TaxID=2609666 RepID=UPI001E4E274C|nr:MULTISPECIES: DsbC family protein [unclassified Halomonas]MDT0501705.1 DsbC family protein [Halomonas sp. PAR7]MDT0512033.1 DsbC family protein [Halomonas sp. LES1]MDT0590830.1 DsbC family protein [Halomonas sp. PAR8]